MSGDPAAAYAPITRKIAMVPLAYPDPVGWAVWFGCACALLALFLIAAGAVFGWGIGMWGNNIPVGWGIAIANYVWFLGIGHAGTPSTVSPRR
jgi:molybdopterin-containing oxidoreductase family membrane subunit